MAEHKTRDYKSLGNAPKVKRYEQVESELEERLDKNAHPLSTTSNLIAILKEEFNWWWVGYYWVTRQEELEYLALAQCQGPAACPRLFRGKGVCGEAWERAQAVIVEDVHKHEGHIACTSTTKSEIVIPIEHEGKVVGVLDVDSDQFGTFDKEDEKWLRHLLGRVGELGHYAWFAKGLL